MNTNRITFNEFTQETIKRGLKITEMKTRLIKDKMQLLLHVTNMNTPAIFNWDQSDKRWILSEG